MAQRIVFLNGFFIPIQSAKISILDRGFSYGDGLFETMRAYKGKVFRLGWHMDRLFDSLPLIGMDLPVTQREMADIVRETVDRNSWPSAYVRLMVTRGEAPPGLLYDAGLPATVAVLAQPYNPPSPKKYQKGVSVVLVHDGAAPMGNLAHKVKSCNFLPGIIFRTEAKGEGCEEAFLLDRQGRLTEGTTSNIFLVKNGILKTPPLNQYVLAGVTRRAVLGLANQLKIPVREENLSPFDLYTADEAFITNTGVELLSVTRVARKIIADGKPGAMTKLLHKAYLKSVDEETDKC